MKINWAKAIGLTAAAAMLLPLAACGSSNNSGAQSNGSTEAVTLSVWAPQEDQAKDTNWLGKVEENFAKAHPEYKITWKNDVVSEGDASKQVSTDPSAAADVYMFASDQLGVLMDAKAIGQLGTDAEKQVKEQNGDLEVNSVTGTDGKIYGVPYTDNTWFMYYNKSKITEDEAKAQGIPVKKGKYLMTGNGRSIIDEQERGFIKVIAHAETDAVLGAQLMCARATDIVSELSTAIVNGLTCAQLASVIRPHPTFCEGVTEAVEDVHGMAIHLAPKKR